MAQQIAIVRNTLPTNISGTSDFTSSGFGTPTAALIFISGANTTNNPANGALLSVGFWDGTSQRAMMVGSSHNTDVTSTPPDFGRTDVTLAGMAGSISVPNDLTISNITNGIRLTLSAGGATVVIYATVVLFKGISAKTLSFTPHSTNNTAQESSSIGFAPKLIFFTTAALAADSSSSLEGFLSFGFAEIGGKHRMFAIGNQENGAATQSNMTLSATRCVGKTVSGTLGWAGEITTWGSDTFTMTTRDGGPGGTVCFALALGGADLEYDAGTLTSPVSTGNDDISTTIAPDVILTLLSSVESTGTVATDGTAEGVSIGISDGTNDYSHGITIADGVDTSDTHSLASSTEILELGIEEAGLLSEIANASVDSFGADYARLNWTTIPPGSSVQGFWLVFTSAITFDESISLSSISNFTQSQNAEFIGSVITSDDLSLFDTTNQTIQLLVTDTLTLTDDVSPILIGLLNHVNDDLTLTDTATENVAYLLSLLDTLVLADQGLRIIEASGDGTLSLSDDNSVTNFEQQDVVDTVGISDAFEELLLQAQNQVDNLELIQTLEFVKFPVVETANILLLSDEVAHLVETNLTVSQTIGITDDQILFNFEQQDVVDTLGITDSNTIINLAVQNTIDALSLSDNNTVTNFEQQDLSQDLTLTDSQLESLVPQGNMSDSLSLSDSLTITNFEAQSLAHSLTLSQALIAAREILISLCHCIDLEHSGKRTIEESAEDTLTLLDSVLQDPFNQTIGITDSVETNALASSCCSAGTYYIPDKSLTDTIGITDEVSHGMDDVISVSQSLNLLNTAAYYV